MEVASGNARIEHVTVYASGARVRRVTTIPAPLPSRVRIVGLPLAVIDDTVRVEVGGPAIATAVRSGVDVPSQVDVAPEDSSQLVAARRRFAIAEAEVARLGSALEVVSSAPVVEPDHSDLPPAAWEAIVSARAELVALRAARELALREQLVAARREVDVARRALDTLIEIDRRAGTARAPKVHQLRKYVEIDLTATAASEIAIHLEYLVGSARWAPSYVARLDGEHVSFEVRAVVAQDAGEDWTGVALALSTAEPERFAQLPELHAQKIGRRQSEPARPGFRAPPVGADALYADYDRTLASKRRAQARPAEPAPPPSPVAYGAAVGSIAAEVWDEESSRAKDAFATPPRGMPAPSFGPPGAALAPQAAKKRMSTRGGDGAAAPARDTTPPPLPAITPRLDYGNLRMAPPSSPQRGQLVAAPLDRHATAIASEVTNADARLAALPLPPGCVTGWSHAYDYAFSTDGAVDVRADGAWHAIAVTARASAAKVRHVAVPREQQDVFRVATIANPLASPLLPGPIDVYDRGHFLVTSVVAELTPPGASVEIGLGVDAAVKLARVTEFREEATGMLRGGLRLIHGIAIDIDNKSGRAIELEVRERLPVKRDGDDEVEIVVGKVEPAWERWAPDPSSPRAERLRGGYRWRLAVPAGAKRTLRAGYEIKIAGKLELAGGNRREL